MSLRNCLVTVQYHVVDAHPGHRAVQMRVPDAGLPPGVKLPHTLMGADPRLPDADPNDHCGEWLWVRDPGNCDLLPRWGRTGLVEVKFDCCFTPPPTA